jgi:hypothetical protein
MARSKRAVYSGVPFYGAGLRKKAVFYLFEAQNVVFAANRRFVTGNYCIFVVVVV